MNYLKFNFLFFTFISLLFFQSDLLSNEVIISERIGSDIDTVERAYFKLFPRMKNFRYAKAYQDNDSTIRFEVDYDSLSVTKRKEIRVDTNTFRELRRAIDDYEYLYSDDPELNQQSFKWTRKLWELIIPAFRMDPENFNVLSFKTKEGKLITGKLIWIDSNYICLFPDTCDFIPQTVIKQIEIYHYSEIYRVYKPNNIYFYGLKSVYLLNLEFLSKYSMYCQHETNSNYYPPELQGYFPELVSKQLKPSSGDTTVYSNLIRISTKFHLYFSFIPFVHYPSINTLTLFDRRRIWVGDQNNSQLINIDSGAVTTEVNYGRKKFEMVFDYNLSSNSRIGIEVLLFANKEKEHLNTTYSDVYNAKSSGFALVANYTQIFKNYNPYLLTNFKRFYASLSFGLLVGNMNSEIDIFFKKYTGILLPNEPRYIDTTHSISQIFFGGKLSFSLEYYILENLSLQSKVFFEYIPNLYFPLLEQVYHKYYNRKAVIKDEKHILNCYGISLGLGYHF